MKVTPIAAMVVCLAATCAIGAGITIAVSEVSQTGQVASSMPDPASAARTSFPGLVAATGEPTLPGLSAVKPQPGAVVRVAGPFDDRLTIDELVLDGARVSGRVHVTSDVSDILELATVAGFYDRAGRLLGTNRFVVHLAEHHDTHTGPPSQTRRFTIAAPSRVRDRVASAAVGVPVLVNE